MVICGALVGDCLVGVSAPLSSNGAASSHQPRIRCRALHHPGLHALPPAACTLGSPEQTLLCARPASVGVRLQHYLILLWLKPWLKSALLFACFAWLTGSPLDVLTVNILTPVTHTPFDCYKASELRIDCFLSFKWALRPLKLCWCAQMI